MMDKGTVFVRPSESFYSTGNFATSVPVNFVTAKDNYYYGDDDGGYNDDDDKLHQILPLPASKYRYSKWSELDENDITSDMLKSPRIRKAPTGFKVDTIWMLEEQERTAINTAADLNVNDMLHHENKSKKRKRWGKGKRKQYQNKLENWEQCEFVNLSYQDLGHNYQTKEFIKVLRRLIRSEMVELIEDSLSDLSSVFFPKCKYLFLQRNHMTNLKKLPKFGCIEHISLQQNNIVNLNGLEVLKKTTIKSLILRENPVSLQPNYRKRVFTVLPGLLFLDDLPRLSSDSDISDTGNEESNRCIIF